MRPCKKLQLVLVIQSPRSQSILSNYDHVQSWKDLDRFHVCQQPRDYLGDEDLSCVMLGPTLKVHLYYHVSIHHLLSQTDL